jgi:hypothetical protein
MGPDNLVVLDHQTVRLGPDIPGQEGEEGKGGEAETPMEASSPETLRHPLCVPVGKPTGLRPGVPGFYKE